MATEVLLKALVQGSTVSQAVQVAMDQVGPDPEYGSVLGYYPAEGALVTVWSLALAQTNSVAFEVSGDTLHECITFPTIRPAVFLTDCSITLAISDV